MGVEIRSRLKKDVSRQWHGSKFHGYSPAVVTGKPIVREGGYDTKVNETVNVVTTKTTEIGQKTRGIMRGVMALASQKVEYTKEGSTGTGTSWKADNWQRNESEGNGYYQEFAQESKGWSSGGGKSSSGAAHNNSVSSGSWDDWDQKDNIGKKNPPQRVQRPVTDKKTVGHNGKSDGKDDGFDHFYQSASSDKKTVGHNGKSDSNWTDGGFL